MGLPARRSHLLYSIAATVPPEPGSIGVGFNRVYDRSRTGSNIAATLPWRRLRFLSATRQARHRLVEEIKQRFVAEDFVPKTASSFWERFCHEIVCIDGHWDVLVPDDVGEFVEEGCEEVEFAVGR